MRSWPQVSFRRCTSPPLAEYKNAAWPTGLCAEYERDAREVENYARAARTPEGFQAYMTGSRSAA